MLAQQYSTHLPPLFMHGLCLPQPQTSAQQQLLRVHAHFSLPCNTSMLLFYLLHVQYISKLMLWIEKQINDEHIFPRNHKAGKLKFTTKLMYHDFSRMICITTYMLCSHPCTYNYCSCMQKDPDKALSCLCAPLCSSFRQVCGDERSNYVYHALLSNL